MTGLFLDKRKDIARKRIESTTPSGAWTNVGEALGEEEERCDDEILH